MGMETEFDAVVLGAGHNSLILQASMLNISQEVERTQFNNRNRAKILGEASVILNLESLRNRSK